MLPYDATLAILAADLSLSLISFILNTQLFLFCILFTTFTSKSLFSRVIPFITFAILTFHSQVLRRKRIYHKVSQ